MTPEEKAAIVTAKLKILEHLGTQNPGRKNEHFVAACKFPGRFVHGSHGLPYSRVVDRALQELRKANLIRYDGGQWWLTKELGITVKEIDRDVEEIRKIADEDPEAAHGNEKNLWRAVLASIADGAPNADKLAAAALKTTEIKFRW